MSPNSQPADPPAVTLIVAMRNEEDNIEACVRSVLDQEYPGRIELLLVDGRSSDRSRQIVEGMIVGRMDARVIDNPRIIQAAAWNLGIAQATGDVIGIVSGHAELAPDYVACAVAAIDRTGADMVGGPARAISFGPVGEAVALANTTPFGVGGARFRYTTRQERVDTVYMGLCRREVYRRIRFDEEMVSNEGDELSYRLLDAGGVIVCDPRIRSAYRNRATIGDLWRQYFQYGFWKVRVMEKHPRQVRPRHLIQATYVTSMAVTAGLSPVSGLARKGLVAAVAAYLAANVAASLLVAARARRPRLAPIRPVAFATVHLGYGLGVIAGLGRRIAVVAPRRLAATLARRPAAAKERAAPARTRPGCWVRSDAEGPRRANRIVFLTHYYPPEVGAPQTRIHETARGLVALGRSVRIVTGPPHYPDGKVRSGYGGLVPHREVRDGIPVLRMPVMARANRGLVDRTIDQASFAATALAAVQVIRSADIVVVESPPLFLGLTAAALARLSGRPYAFHVADPWPDFPIAMGALEDPLLRRAAFKVESIAYRDASLVTTVSPGLCRLLEAKPTARGKVRLLPNGVDLDRFHPEADAPALRRELGWPEATLTLAYVGSVGLAQGVGTLIEAVAPLERQGIVLHVVGDGYERSDLAQTVAERGLWHIRFHDAVAQDVVPTILGACDAAVVLLRRGRLHEHSLPTKLVEGLASGRPVIVSADGDAADIVNESGAGMTAPAEDAPALRAVILAAVVADREALGAAARRVASERFDRRVIVRRLAELLDEALNDGRSSRSA
jgi:glycosyltransferase involved in cell wall biosynthesis